MIYVYITHVNVDDTSEKSKLIHVEEGRKYKVRNETKHLLVTVNHFNFILTSANTNQTR